MLPLLIKQEKLNQILLVSKSSKPHTERRANSRTFLFGEHATTSNKTRKLNQIFLV